MFKLTFSMKLPLCVFNIYIIHTHRSLTYTDPMQLQFHQLPLNNHIKIHKPFRFKYVILIKLL